MSIYITWVYYVSREGAVMINTIGSVERAQTVYINDKNTAEKRDNVQKDETAVILELGNREEGSATYAKPVTAGNSKEISRLWNETAKSYESLREIVVRLIVRQGRNIDNVLSGKEELFVDGEARAEAERLLAEDGELGVKAVSARIVSFARALSGGDKSKLAELRAAIEKGFREAERIFGGELPQICRDTFDEVMRQLDEWEREEA